MEIILDKTRWDILNHQAKVKILITGRRWGKSVLSAVFLLHQPFQQGERRLYIAPYYRQAKLIMFPLMKELMLQFGDVKINETELSFRFDNGAELSLKGADNPDSLRGISLGKNGSNGVVLDEMAYIKEGFFEEVITPMLLDHNAKALLTSTPNGFNHLYSKFLLGLGKNPMYKSWQFTTLEHGMISKEAVLEAKKTMTADQYKQEMLGTFLTAGNKAVWNFDRNVHLQPIKDMPPQMFFGLDFNVATMACIVMGRYSDGTVVAVDELVLHNSNTDEMARLMKKKYPYVKDCYPDPAGKSRSTVAVNNRSDHSILREHGFNVYAKNKAPHTKDRLYSLNRLLKDSEGKIRMTVAPKCVNLIKDYELCQRDNNGNLSKKDENLTHFLDASSYYIDLKEPAYRRTATTLEF